MSKYGQLFRRIFWSLSITRPYLLDLTIPENGQL